MNKPQSKNYLDRFLSLFAETRSGEGVNVVLLTLNIFLILTAYYIAKVVREPLILAGGGAEIKSYSAAGQAILLIGAVRLYDWLANTFPRRKLINIVVLFFTFCLILFYILAQMEVPLGIVFYLWVGIFSLMVVSQFWAFANDLYTPEAGKRLFAIVAFGASAGAVFGSSFAGLLIEPLGIYQLLLVSAGLLFLSLLITNFVDSREKSKVVKIKQITDTAEEAIGGEGAFTLILKNRYLLLIGILILLLNWVNTTGEYILGKIVTADAAQNSAALGLTVGEYIGKFYADFFTVVNIVGVLVQLFLVSRILKYLGIRIAILILPFIALGGYVFLAFFPILSIVRWTKTAENATDYSLQNTVRHVLFLPTTREQKYKAKQAIDTFFQRAGDVLSAVIVYVGVNLLAFETSHFALFNLMLVCLWLFVAFRIGVLNKKLGTEKLINNEVE
ncbi:MAG: MFS transporter [Calditrichaeota bacterium]|nr:MAG: MFS transporter [Calditrichota bacterium]